MNRRPFWIWSALPSSSCLHIIFPSSSPPYTSLPTVRPFRLADTAKQALGMLEMHFVNLFLSALITEQECIM